jgi:hypothetical protein
VDFDMPNAPDGVQAQGHAVDIEPDGIIDAVVVDNPGSGYSAAPGVVIRDGTLYDPVNHDPGTFTEATATATLFIQSVVLDAFGEGYNNAPDVIISDPTGTGALATAELDNGIISAITVKKAGSGYLTQGGIKKFVDGLPVLCIPTVNFSECASVANNLGQYIPIAVPDTTTFPGSDYYVIAVVQYRERMSSSLPATGTAA